MWAEGFKLDLPLLPGIARGEVQTPQVQTACGTPQPEATDPPRNDLEELVGVNGLELVKKPLCPQNADARGSGGAMRGEKPVSARCLPSRNGRLRGVELLQHDYVRVLAHQAQQILHLPLVSAPVRRKEGL